jgi:anti-sigma factor RsiW
MARERRPHTGRNPAAAAYGGMLTAEQAEPASSTARRFSAESPQPVVVQPIVHLDARHDGWPRHERRGQPVRHLSRFGCGGSGVLFGLQNVPGLPVGGSWRPSLFSCPYDCD